MGYPIYHSEWTAAQIEASIGKSPIIDESTGEWMIWDIESGSYIGTGVMADAQDAAARAEAALAEILSAYTTAMLGPVPIASFDDGADGIPVKSMTVNIAPVQAGSGDPSPSNVRPISGWTGAQIPRTGINICGTQWELGRYNATTGNKQAATDRIRSADYIPVSPADTYYIRCDYATPTSGFFLILCYDAAKNYLGNVSVTEKGSFSTLPNTRYIAVSVSALYGTTYNNDISINYPATDTDYHAYAGTVYAVDWQSEAGTVYGCTLTDNGDGTWTLVPTWSIVDLSTLTWAYTGGRWRSESLAGQIKSSPNLTVGELVAERYQSTPFNDIPQTTGSIGVSSSAILACNTGDSTTAPSGQLAYALATPLAAVTLTAASVRTLLGDNNIWADCGDIEALTYRADPSIYIDARLRAAKSIIAGVETAMSATRNYAVGDLLIVGDTLYKVTAAIASGGAITAGVNVTATTVAEQLLLLANI